MDCHPGLCHGIGLSGSIGRPDLSAGTPARDRAGLHEQGAEFCSEAWHPHPACGGCFGQTGPVFEWDWRIAQGACRKEIILLPLFQAAGERREEINYESK